MSKQIEFNGFKKLISKKEILINVKKLSKRNNYFENTDLDKMRIFIDLDGKTKLTDEKEFNELNKKYLNVLKSIDDISIITSSHFKSEKWEYNRDTKEEELTEISPKLSYRITFINEYCENINDMRTIVENEKQEELKKLFNEYDLSIGTKDELLKIDTAVYRKGIGKIRCVNAYKHIQQKERINKLVKGEIEDTIISHIPDDCSLKRPIQKKIIQKEKITKDKIKNETIEKEIFINSNMNNTNSDIKELLDGLDKKRYTDFNYWIKAYWIFLNEKLDMDLFKYFSKKDKNYNEKNNENILKKFKPCNGLKISTLYFWLKEDNYELFKKLSKVRKDVWNALDNMNQSDIAKMYYSISKNKYVRSNISGWYEYNNNNVLVFRCDNTTTPSSLLNNISNSLQDYITEQRNFLTPDNEFYNINMKIYKVAYKNLGQSSYIKGVMEYLKDLYTVEDLDSLLDSKIDLLCFTDYVYDMKIKKFREIQTTDYITKTTKYKAPITIDNNNNISIKYSKENRENINKLIKSIFEDDEMEEYFKIVSGLTLFTNKLQSIFIHTGSGGNGKGVLSSIVRSCLGDYFLTGENTFLTTPYKAGAPNSTLNNAKSVKYLSVSEPDNGKGCNFNADFIKSLTGDPITTRTLYKDNITYIPQFSAHIQCNNKPSLTKLDGGIVRRIKVIPYQLSFVDSPKLDNERQKNYNLSDVIDKEEFKNEFIIMLIEKATEYYNTDYSKLKKPKKVDMETSNYINDNNPIKDWIDKYIIRTDNIKDRKKTTEIMNLYNEDKNTERQLNSKEMMEFMTYNEFKNIKSKGVKYYTNLKIREIEEDDTDTEENNI